MMFTIFMTCAARVYDRSIARARVVCLPLSAGSALASAAAGVAVYTSQTIYMIVILFMHTMLLCDVCGCRCCSGNHRQPFPNWSSARCLVIHEDSD